MKKQLKIKRLIFQTLRINKIITMKTRISILSILLLLSFTVKTFSQDEYIYHYSILSALNDKVYTGNLMISDLKKHGDLGLGTYNYLNGEMVIVDGTVYKVLPSGKIVEADDNELSPYAMITKFDVDTSLLLKNISSYGELKKKLSEFLPSKNIFYALKIKGDFSSIKCGSVNKQEPPFEKRLLETLAERPIFSAKDISGTLVGLWCPEYIIDINAPGYHLHFVDEHLTIGGHLLEVDIKEVSIEIDIIRGYRMQLQDSDDFDKVELLLNDPEKNY